MFNLTVFKKTMIMTIMLLSVYNVLFHLYIVPEVDQEIKTLERDNAKAILANMVQKVNTAQYDLESFEKNSLKYHKNELKNLTNTIWSLAQTQYMLSSSQASKEEFLNRIQYLRYEDNNYFYISDYNNILISHPYLRDKDMSDIKDINGNLIVPPMVDVAKKKGEAFYTYYWQKNSSDLTPYKKLTFSKDFPKWEFVIGTGVYLDDIKKEVENRKNQLLEHLRESILSTKINKTGYLYIFDGDGNMLVHPNSNIDGTNIKKVKNPDTGTFIFDDLVKASKQINNELYYSWDKPSDPGNYVYKKISWVEYVREFDWYIASSVYEHEMQSSSQMLVSKINLYSMSLFIFIIFASYVYFKRILSPISKLQEMVQKINSGDYDVSLSIQTNDEIGKLAKSFNSMSKTIKYHIENLDSNIKEKTAKLELKRKESDMILKSILIPVLITDKKTRKIVYANKYASIQYEIPLEKLKGMDIDDIYSVQGQQLHIIEALRTKGYVDNFEEDFVTKTGKEFTALLSVIPIVYKEKECYIGMVTDITKQKNVEKEIRRINQHTKESIEYASLIQEALIPDDRLMEHFFQDSFQIWKPKDIVGGDIYLVEEVSGGDGVIVMVIDCTGHGVPGAFVTMLVKAIERQIIAIINSNDFIEVSPAWILSYFNKTIKKLLKQETKESVNNAGFDGSVVYYDKTQQMIKFAASQNSLFYINDDKIVEIKGDRHSVGYKKSDSDFVFTEHNLDVKSGDCFYMTTDGYLDQNGGEKGFPYGKKRFKLTLESNYQKSFQEQKEILLEHLHQYQQESETNDDITIVGMKI